MFKLKCWRHEVKQDPNRSTELCEPQVFGISFCTRPASLRGTALEGRLFLV